MPSSGAGVTGMDLRALRGRLHGSRSLRPHRAVDTVDPDEVAAVLSADGPLSRAVSGFEERPQQIEMARAVARRGHEVSIFATDNGGTGVSRPLGGNRTEPDGLVIRHFPVVRPRFWMFSPALEHALGKEIPRVDVVHLHSLYLFHDKVVGRECRRVGVPYLLMPHGSLDPYLYRRHRLRKTLLELWFQNAVTRGAAAIHFITEEEHRLATPYVFGVRGVVVPLGLEMNEYRPLPPRSRFRAAHPEIGGRPIVLFLGRLNFKKGLDVLIRAFAGAVRTVDAHLVIAGPDDGMGAKARAWVDAHGLRARTTFTGMVTGAAKPELLSDSDLFVLPSYSENFGIAVIEAMACGLPVAVSDRVNLWREVADADAGWVAPPGPEPFRAALVEALSDPRAAREKGARGLRLVAERFQWSGIAPALESLYASLR